MTIDDKSSLIFNVLLKEKARIIFRLISRSSGEIEVLIYCQKWPVDLSTLLHSGLLTNENLSDVIECPVIDKSFALSSKSFNQNKR